MRLGARVGALLALALAHCAPMRITLPALPAEPVTAWLVDYGRHASLLLPRRTGGLVEYAYGERAWYAEDRCGWWRLPVVMLWPTQGTLGRREVRPATPEHLRADLDALALTPLPVAAEALTALRDRLDRRYAARRDTERFQPRYGMDFVVDPDPYWFGHQCNQELAGWLEELGCEVRGCRWFADFEVFAGGGAGVGATSSAAGVVSSRSPPRPAPPGEDDR